MGYGYLAHRYTSEFVPVLAFGAAVGHLDVSSVVSTAAQSWVRRSFAATTMRLLLFGMVANTAAGLRLPA